MVALQADSSLPLEQTTSASTQAEPHSPPGKARPLIEQLDPPTRSLLLVSLVILILVGIVLMLFAWTSGRHFKRVARKRPPQRVREISDWDRTHSVEDEPLEEALPEDSYHDGYEEEPDDEDRDSPSGR